MKIVFFHHSIALYAGIERVFTDKMNYFADVWGWDVFILTCQQGEHPLSYKLSPKVTHHDMDCRFVELYRLNPLRKYLKSFQLERQLAKRLQKELDAINPDILVTTNMFTPWLVAVNRCKTNAIRIAESHIYKGRMRYVGSNGSWLSRLTGKIGERRIISEIRKMDLLVALTAQDANEWKGIINTSVIPNIVTLYPQNVHYDKESRHAIAVGRLETQKGFDMLVEIWRRVAERHPDWTLDIYGDGEERHSLARWIKDSAMDGKIVVHPPVSNIYDKYQESAMLLFSSRYEGFALALAEAMACALPVVAFDCPCGPRDVLGADSPYLIPPYDIPLFADKVCRLIENQEERLRQSALNRTKAREYTRENVMHKWKELYETLLNKRRQEGR